MSILSCIHIQAAARQHYSIFSETQYPYPRNPYCDAKFLPIVTDATKDVQLAQQYNKFAEMGSQYGLVNKDQANLET